MMSLKCVFAIIPGTVAAKNARLVSPKIKRNRDLSRGLSKVPSGGGLEKSPWDPDRLGAVVTRSDDELFFFRINGAAGD